MFEAIQGRDKILMFRRLSKATEDTAGKLALQTEHTLNYSRSTSTTQTKDGTVSSKGGLEVTVSINAVSTDDEVNNMMFEAMEAGEILECWEINLAKEDESGKYAALYMQGLLDTWEVPSDSENVSEFSANLIVNDKPKKGYATLTEQQQEEIAYAFRDTTPYVEPAG